MSYVKVRRVTTHFGTRTRWLYSTYECKACGWGQEFRNHGIAVEEAADHAATCPAIAIAVERDKLARRVQRLQTALDRLTAATILPDTPPC